MNYPGYPQYCSLKTGSAGVPPAEITNAIIIIPGHYHAVLADYHYIRNRHGTLRIRACQGISPQVQKYR